MKKEEQEEVLQDEKPMKVSVEEEAKIQKEIIEKQNAEKFNCTPGRAFNVDSFEDIYLMGGRAGGEITVLCEKENKEGIPLIGVTIPYALRVYLWQEDLLPDPDLNCFFIEKTRFLRFIEEDRLKLIWGCVLRSDCVNPPKW